MSLADQCQLLHQTFHGPPTELDVTMYSKSKIRAHPFLGHTRVRIWIIKPKTYDYPNTFLTYNVDSSD